MADDSPVGPEVPAHENLFRCIFHPDWWDADNEIVSSAVFAFPKFSAYLASKTTDEEVAARFREGSGVLQFNAGVARALLFDARHEPENDDDAHANVYRLRKKKKQTRRLMEAAETFVTIRPNIELL